MSKLNTVEVGDCLSVLRTSDSEIVDLIYLDPPFFTQRQHATTTKKGDKTFSFADKWLAEDDYLSFMAERIVECKRVLKRDGSFFLHCDRNAVHKLKILCDEIFGKTNFKSEIIWTYKRWSNSSNSLMPAHQTILYYTVSNTFTFNKIFTDYSESTNVDQILQNRTRDSRNKSVYAKTKEGNVVQSDSKKGVPLSDVWEIPYLNPKAKERVDYPTQKPILLLERIIQIATNKGDLVLDPFCGSGTTLVAAKLNERNFWGIDESEDAFFLTNERLKSCVKTSSQLMKKGRDSYKSADVRLKIVLANLPYKSVHRNKGIDAVLDEKDGDCFIFVRLQKDNEDVNDGITLLKNAMDKKGRCKGVFVVFSKDNVRCAVPKNIKIVYSIDSQMR